MFMLSDANLAMYGVSPTSLATALMSDPMVILSAPTAPLSPAADAFPQRISLNTSDCCRQVNSYAIFIAGEAAAESLKQEMPVGHARAHARSRFALCAASTIWCAAAVHGAFGCVPRSSTNAAHQRPQVSSST